jgi:hypothetical protein
MPDLLIVHSDNFPQLVDPFSTTGGKKSEMLALNGV